MTEGNTQKVLHDESWEKITELLRREAEQTGNPTLDAIANTIENQ
jgi:hypothetical protein